jgi:hypothetical protein
MSIVAKQTVKTVAIILSGQGGELDREEIDFLQDEDIDEVLGNRLMMLVERCTFSIGDTITIVEVRN